MSYLSSAAWIAHDLGLATTIGGTLFGQGALHPALNERLGDDQERKMVADAAWRKFTWMNLARGRSERRFLFAHCSAANQSISN